MSPDQERDELAKRLVIIFGDSLDAQLVNAEYFEQRQPGAGTRETAELLRRAVELRDEKRDEK